MGHAKEIITIDAYGDNKGIISDCTPELEPYCGRSSSIGSEWKSIGIRAVGHSSRCKRFMKWNRIYVR